MALNAFFDQGGGLDSTGFSLEQQLIENLYTEAIKIYEKLISNNSKKKIYFAKKIKKLKNKDV